ncbi:MAG TPA: ABC transporter ATP-binding protein [Gammaproteobacteria bacterium]
MDARIEPAPHVRLAEVTKAYGPTVVLDRVDFSAERGEFVVIVGRSGSGKSTLLRLIGGLEEPDRGAILYGDRRLDGMSENERAAFRRREIGFVFQFFNLIPTLTVAENVALPLALNGVPKADAAARVAALLEDLELAGSGERFPEELSGGEQQRVAIARAIAHEPGIVLADEPTGNLDLETAERVLALLDDVCRRHHATLVMATHSREVIGRADRVLTIRSASLVETPP